MNDVFECTERIEIGLFGIERVVDGKYAALNTATLHRNQRCAYVK